MMKDSEDTSCTFLRKMHKEVLRHLKRMQEVNIILVVIYTGKKNPIHFKKTAWLGTNSFYPLILLGLMVDF